ncbi:Glycosyltransferase family 4 protein [Rhodovastum atsumiense]|uniref:Glycosyltransferase family 4 protein n=1 Tax=Rhodovastum atsumiense TaxID=504468 RepID=A0A5M6J0J6_9PROT|nr:glycosyltransferase [Rhodovastum atsumiense]KAA5614093.1 glycosyltransferase family 4 protein [Rhodovastum atsumiense]CAH2598917.1 Glycosyltransferase family 4 protein [Rhodovastum atsumiense]
MDNTRSDEIVADSSEIDLGIPNSVQIGRYKQKPIWPAPELFRSKLPPRPNLRIALVHEWLETYAGSERVLEQLLQCFPEADVFAVVDFVKESERAFLGGRKVNTTFIQHMPFARRNFRNYIGLMPIAVQQLDVSGYDVIISNNHAVAKGVLTGPDQIHVAYVHSPMRYAWDLQHQYLAQSGLKTGLKGAYARWLLGRLRQWDVVSSHQVDHFAANSNYIARRVGKVYRRNARVIFPPVNTDRFQIGPVKDDFYLVACRFVPYKRVDVVVESFARHPDRKLVVVGDGPERERVRRAAQNAPNIFFKGVVPQPELIDLLQRARAYVYAAEEDFGIALAEAQACGTPVIAFGRGGAVDIVVTEENGQPTGLLFDRQDADAVSEAIDRFERIESDITKHDCRLNALRFSEPRFRQEFHDFVGSVAGF